MHPDDIAYFKQILDEQRRQLESQANGTLRNLLSSDQSAADPLDRATIDSEYTTSVRIRTRESRLIAKIDAAIDRIEDGSFGICLECEEDISVARLKARPVAALCIQCKTRQEISEKAGILPLGGFPSAPAHRTARYVRF